MEGHGKVVVVTGCTTGGIGYGLAKEMFDRGCIVYATARRPEMVDPVASEAVMGGRWKSLPLDVTSEASIRSAVDTVLEEQGRIDVLVNNAGIGAIGPMAEFPLAQAKAAYEINVFGTIACCQAVIPSMVAAKSGTIVNVGSAVGLFSTPWSGVYASTKAAIHNFSDAMRMELAPLGVHVMVLAPGAILSNLGKNNTSILDASYLKIFKPWENDIKERAVASQTTKGATPNAAFAKIVVPKILAHRPPDFFLAGCLSALFKLFTFLPKVFVKWFLMAKFKLNKPVQTNHASKDE